MTMYIIAQYEIIVIVPLNTAIRLMKYHFIVVKFNIHVVLNFKKYVYTAYRGRFLYDPSHSLRSLIRRL